MSQSPTRSPARTRTSRGAARREALVVAAAELFVEGGAGAVAHRAVAARAGVPLAATTYYFDSLDDLLVAAMTWQCERWAAASADVLAGLPPRLRDARLLAGAAVAVLLPVPAEALLPLYERYVEAGRHPRLAAPMAAWNEHLEGLLDQVVGRSPHSGVGGRLLLTVIDGTVLRALAEHVDPVAAAERAVVDLVG